MSELIQFAINKIFEMMVEAINFLSSIEIAENVSYFSVAICAIILPIVIRVMIAQINVRGRIR